MSDNEKPVKKNVLLDENLSLEKLALEGQGIDINDLSSIRDLADKQKEMNAFLLDRFERNMQAFEKYMPDIAKTFSTYKPKKQMEFFCLPNGIPNLYFPERNEFFYKTADPFELCKKQVVNILENTVLIQTRYTHERDPYGQIHFKYSNTLVNIESEKERDRTLSPAKIGSVPNCMFLGLGLGYSLAYLYERVEVANIVIVEPDLDVFYASLHAFDWENLLNFLFENKYGIHLMLGQTPVQFTIDLVKFYERHGRFLSGSWLGIVHYVSKDIKAIADITMRDIDSVHSAMGFFDDHLFGSSHACHAILDRKAFVNRHATLDKKLAKAPVFIIGSGPSLDHDIQFIRKNQDKAIIIACGTAIDSLYHAGIKPDFYACTERTPEILQALSVIPDKSFYDDIVLLTGDVIHPNTTSMFKHTAIFGKIDEPFYKYGLARLKQFRFVDFVQLMNPLVGNMGVAGALFLGFKNLYLFGIDNGRKVGSASIHSELTSLYKKHNCSDSGGNYTTKMIRKGNFGGEVETGVFFELSARNIGYNLSMLANAGKEIKCYNCSDGLYIDNTIPVHSEDLNFDRFKDIDKNELRRFMYEEKTRVVDASREEIENMFLYDGFVAVVDNIKKVLKEKPKTRLETIQHMETVSELLYTLQGNPATYFYGSAIEGSLQTYFIIISRALYNSTDEKDCLERAYRMFDVVIDFLEESKSLFKHLPDYILGDHQKFFKDGKVGIDTPTCKAPNLPVMPNLLSRTEYDDPMKVFVKRYD
ncbi:MAG: 6-hydroxymethylpterin diphosphokinase MptE-like protein [Succinivibrio sp.]